MIRDYQEHRLAELAASDKGRNQLAKKLEAALVRPVEDLTRLLRSEPLKSNEINIEGLEIWKQRVDDLRKKYYNLSMNAIDTIFQDVHPSVEATEEHNQVLTNLSRIVAMEERILQIKHSLTSKVYDEEEIHSSLNEQEKEAYILEHSIEHTPEIQARLETVNRDLREIKEFLQASM